MDLINKIEAPILSRMQRLNFTNWVSADTMLAAVVVEPRVIENKFSANATVELTGIYTRGQIVIDHLNTKRHNVTIIKSLRAGLFKELLSSIGSN